MAAGDGLRISAVADRGSMDTPRRGCAGSAYRPGGPGRLRLERRGVGREPKQYGLKPLPGSVPSSIAVRDSAAPRHPPALDGSGVIPGGARAMARFFRCPGAVS